MRRRAHSSIPLLLVLGTGPAAGQEAAAAQDLAAVKTIEVPVTVHTEATASGISVVGTNMLPPEGDPVAQEDGSIAGSAFGWSYVIRLDGGVAHLRATRADAEAIERGPVELGRGSYVFADIPVADMTAGFALRDPARSPGEYRLTVMIPQNAFLHGTVLTAHGPRELVVADRDWDGIYGSAGDYWGLLSAEHIEAKGGRFSSYSLIETVEPIHLPDGRVARLDAAGRQLVRMSFGPAEDTLSDSLARRHARVMADFLARGIHLKRAEVDAGDRPLATEKVEWRHLLDLEPAFAEARALDLPLLLDFETDW